MAVILLESFIIFKFKKKDKSSNFVKIEASSRQDDNQNWGNADVLINYVKIKYEGQSNTCTKNQPNSFFILSFPRNTIRMTDYTLMTRTNYIDDMPTTWKVEGSNNYNSEEWEYIDHRIKSDSLLQLRTAKTFHVARPGNFRYFKFTHNGTNSVSRYFFCLGKIDIFGKIYGMPDRDCSCAKRRRQSIISFFFYILAIAC